jgi:hypothetical protein
MDSGLVNVTVEGNTAINGTLNCFVGRAASNLWLSCNSAASYILDLGASRSAKVSDYTYRHFAQCMCFFILIFLACCYPKDWNFSGSNDGKNWDILSTHSENPHTSFQTLSDTKTFQVKSKKFYRYFKVSNVGKNSSNWNFGIGAFEIYGKFKGKLGK